MMERLAELLWRSKSLQTACHSYYFPGKGSVRTREQSMRRYVHWKD